MRQNRKLILALGVTILLLAAASLGGRLYLSSRPDALPGSLRAALGLPAPADQARGGAGSAEDLRLYRVPAPAAAARAALSKKLAALGARLGDPLGDGTCLVRVPAARERDAARLLGAALVPHAPEDRLDPSLRSAAAREPAPGAPQSGSPPRDPSAPASGARRPAPLSVNVVAFAPEDRPALARAVKEAGGAVLAGLDDEDGRILRAELPAARLRDIAASPHVVYIEPYAPAALLNDRAADVVGAAPLAVAGFAGRLGLTGAGETVGVADSGLDRGSMSDLPPDFVNPPGVRPKVIMLRSLTGGHPADRDGHGTHVAGTIAGNGAASGGRFRGLAPGAGLYVQAIADRQGQPQPPPDLVSLFRPAYEGGVRVHVNGWGAGKSYYNSSASQVDRFVFWYPDFLPVFGAGNEGPGSGTLTGEANAKNALVVGASSNPRPLLGPETAGASRVASFSSRGPAADGRIRPDLVVPGAGIISNRSRLAPAEGGGDPAYVARQGTSMAAAVAGGAAALLREELRKGFGLKSPSAALVKAVLVNGARPLTGDTAAEGFGRLDLASAVLALEERSFLFEEPRRGIGEGGELTYTYEVESPGQPLCVTLAWTDPPAAPGAARALVNDLDLVVTGPGGRTWRGNDTENRGRRDDVNNVERVRIERPAPGTYKITVRGARVTEPAVYAPAAAQDFALVYGQLPSRGVLSARAANGRAVLSDGTPLSLAGAPPAVAADGRLLSGSRGLPAGADVYYLGSAENPRAVRAAYRTWRENGVRRLGGGEDGGVILASLRAELREGGRRIDPGAGPPLVNGAPAAPARLLDGAEVTAVINPSAQTLWEVSASYRTADGILAAHTGPGGELRLLDGQRYTLAADADLAFVDRIVNGSWADLPFGATATDDLDALLPGMAVSLVIAPSTGKVERVVVSRHLALGALRAVSPGDGALTLETGAAFRLFPGAPVRRDGQAAGLADLAPGDRVQGVLLPGGDAVLALEAFSRVLYGQVLYVSEGRGTLYLNDVHGGFHRFDLTPRTAVFRWGFAAGAGALSSGQWVRLTLDPRTSEVERIDVAETAGEGDGRVAAYDGETLRLELEDGRTLQLSPRSRVTKDGYPVLPRDLKPAEEVRFTELVGLPSTGPVAAAVAARSLPGTAPPKLSARGLPMLDYLFLDGRTDADRVYLYREDGSRQTLQVKDGRFIAPVSRLAGENALRLVAVDGRTGGVAAVTVPFPLSISEPARDAGDVAASWAADAIREARSRGLMAGYPDGRFRPDAAVNRAELTAVLARLLGLHPDPDAVPSFADADRIPAWVRPAVAEAVERGVVSGFPDGTFRASAPVTRAEAAALLVAALDDMALLPAETGDPLPAPPYRDWDAVPEWARPAVARAYAAGILTGREGGVFMPAARLTRAEVAVILSRINVSLES
ncbi:MAG: S-layer homology domain-containing protein [Bacillota bacterium]|nr:S-layer homology domain-containing protein [Bacillota bacterium]